ncbi:Beta-galactosidase 7 -like protein [Gossypium arboreum]|uniref:Beta-galactosidase 7-like protein n=1 Tax=Gossypium arboreum TaxID=29729 RepID=A0A0B0NKT7_GOSAR|nr:Beta-galactosidase 7 -like protein [Gossypium arboreum]
MVIFQNHFTAAVPNRLLPIHSFTHSLHTYYSNMYITNQFHHIYL